MKCTSEMHSSGMIYTEHFMKIGIDVEAVSRFCLSNLKDCNVGVTDKRRV
jgi:hypothetical protein